MWTTCWRSARRSEVFLRALPSLLVAAGWSLLTSPAHAAESAETPSVFPVRQISISLPANQADPFGLELWGWIQREGGGGVWVPAFYDGDGHWKIRCSPSAAGRYHVALYVEEGGVRRPFVSTTPVPDRFEVGGQPSRFGFVRINPANPRRFVRGNLPYFPLGLNIGWDTGPGETVEELLAALAEAGGNWTRIWMCHWDGKNLDWVQDAPNPAGEFDLSVARRWDGIVNEAERLGVPFQVVLQHHGQFSTTVNPNWREHPWNVANGGFLSRPEDFFTDAKALELTRRKLRYIVARYGYSPAIMAWELFNEVEFTDAAKTPEGRRAILEWHEKMAGYLRSIDPYGHLITTSAAPLNDPVWAVSDFFQQHAYPPDPLSAAGGFSGNPLALSRPVFYGEIGTTHPSGTTLGDGGRALRDVLWGSFFAGAGGAAQYWAWDQVAREKLFPLIRSAADFAKLAGLAEGEWRRLPVRVSTEGRADLVFGPGQRWDAVVDPAISLRPDGGSRPEGPGWSATLRPRRGSGERAGSDTVTFEIDAKEPTRWELTVNEVSDDGATLEMSVDGVVRQTRQWEPAAQGKGRTLPEGIAVDVPAGARKLSIKSSGRDYFRLTAMRLQNYAPELGGKAMTANDRAVVWIYRLAGLEDSPLSGGTAEARGTIRVEGLRDGAYRLVWWDTARSEPMGESDVSVVGGNLAFDTPPIRTDAAVLLTRKEGPP